MIDIEGLGLTTSDEKRIRHSLVGGIILFTRNYKDKVQLQELVSAIRSIKPDILIAVDHEGGRVQRFRDQFTKIPKMNLIGQVYEKDKKQAIEYALLIGWLISKELGEFNIDFSFTPVLDIDYGASSVIGDRSFHKKKQPIIQLASSLIKGLIYGGMQAVGKHFPGHGYINTDTHFKNGIDDRILKDIQNSDIEIFDSLIKKGIKGIMPSHIVYSSCDNKPSGLSSFWLQEQLRERLKYKGAIFSDDISMEAVKISEKNITLRVKKALEAGCDMVLVCNSPKEVDELLLKLRWQPSQESINRANLMKLDKIKNNIIKFNGYTYEEIKSIVAKI